MNRFSWTIDSKLRITAGPLIGQSMSSCFPSQDNSSQLWGILDTALSGGVASGSITHAGQPWRIVARHAPGGASGLCARAAAGPTDAAALLAEYNTQGSAIRPLAHDVNNQLGAICNYVELLAHQYPGGRDDFGEIRALAFRAADNLNALRSLSAPLDPTRRRPQALRSWLQAMAAGLRAKHPSHDFVLGPVPDAMLPMVPGDIGQALHAAADNAAAATPTGAPIRLWAAQGPLDVVSLRGWPAQAGTFVHLCLDDPGTGMDHTTLEDALRLHHSSNPIQRGVGLALIASIARQHSGRLRVESAPDVGTRVILSLPLAPPVSAREHNAPAVTAPRPAPQASRATLLIADDTRAVLVATRRVLERHYDVVTAEDGAQALQTFLSDPERFDAVLLDDKMPQMTGEAVAARIQEIRPTIPIVLVTGGAPVTSSLPILEKPYNPDQLLETVSALIGP